MTHPAIHIIEDGDDYQARCDQCGATAAAHFIGDCLEQLVDAPCAR